MVAGRRLRRLRTQPRIPPARATERRGWRSPTTAAEDRNHGGARGQILWGLRWRPPATVAEDRNIARFRFVAVNCASGGRRLRRPRIATPKSWAGKSVTGCGGRRLWRPRIATTPSMPTAVAWRHRGRRMRRRRIATPTSVHIQPARRVGFPPDRRGDSGTQYPLANTVGTPIAGRSCARSRYPPAAALGDTGRVVWAGLVVFHGLQLAAGWAGRAPGGHARDRPGPAVAVLEGAHPSAGHAANPGGRAGRQTLQLRQGPASDAFTGPSGWRRRLPLPANKR
jgi:hypothetical protein